MKSTSFRPEAKLPCSLVSGNKVLRAMTIEVVFDAEPPWTDIPPAWGPESPNKCARAFDVVFSMTVRAGET